MDANDIDRVIAEYRSAVLQRDAATADIDRAEHDAIAKRLRREWAAYNGGDDSELHELAFGEP